MRSAARALSVFRELTSVPTAPFFEHAVAGKALDWVRRVLGRRVSVTRRRGGILVRYRGAGPGPALALAAHIDHPGFHMRRVTRAGAVARLQGGHPKELLAGAAIEAFAARPKDNEPLARGILGEPKDLDFPVKWVHPPKKGDKIAFAILSLTPCTADRRWIASRSIDDLMGAAVSLETLRCVSSEKIKTNLTVLLHKAEEVGFIGALDLIADGAVPPEDSVLSIETSKHLPTARPGKGPVVRVGDRMTLFDPNLVALLDDAAAGLKKKGVRTQRTRLTGGSCEATAYVAFGYESAGVAVPLVNYHNGGDGEVAAEKVRVEDVDGAVRLLLETARKFPAWTLRGRTRERLTARHKALAQGLS